MDGITNYETFAVGGNTIDPDGKVWLTLLNYNEDGLPEDDQAVIELTQDGLASLIDTLRHFLR